MLAPVQSFGMSVVMNNPPADKLDVVRRAIGLRGAELRYLQSSSRLV